MLSITLMACLDDFERLGNIGSATLGPWVDAPLVHATFNATEFITNGDVLTGVILTVEKHLARLVIGEDLEDGALIRVGTLGTKTIVGQEIGEIDIKPWGV